MTTAIPKVTQTSNPDKGYAYRCSISPSGKITVSIGAVLTNDVQFYGSYFCKPEFFNDFS